MKLMPNGKISTLLDSKPSFPPLPEVLSLFDEVFALYESGGESDDEMADVLLDLIDRLSNVSSSMDPSVASRLTAWAVEHWSFTPTHFLDKLCRLLVNSGTPESLAVLRDKLSQSPDPRAKEPIEFSIGCHRVARNEAKDND
jgi:hypothetical protein